MSIALSASTAYSSISSSFQFPVQFRRVLIGGKRVSLPSGRRFRPLVVEAKKQTFSSFDELLSSSEKPVLVDFYATWCGPCQFMVPVLNEVSATLKEKIQIVKIDNRSLVSTKSVQLSNPNFSFSGSNISKLVNRNSQFCDKHMTGYQLISLARSHSIWR